MDRRDRITLLHAAVWLQRLKGCGRRYPPHVLESEIKRGERLLRFTCHDDDAATFDLLERTRLIGLEQPYSYDAVQHELTFDSPTLREQLLANPDIAEIDDLGIVGAVVTQTLSGLGPESEALAPKDERWFTPWDKLVEAFDALVAEQYAERDGGRYRWHPRLLGLLFEWGWTSDLDSDARKARLMKIWESMPAGLKAELTAEGIPDALSLAMIMGYCWRPDDGWSYPPNEPIDAGEIQLKGGHLPTAMGIVELLRAAD